MGNYIQRPFEVVSLALPLAQKTGWCPYCQVELERDFINGQFILFCISCDLIQTEYGG